MSKTNVSEGTNVDKKVKKDSNINYVKYDPATLKLTFPYQIFLQKPEDETPVVAININDKCPLHRYFLTEVEGQIVANIPKED